jgi:hypothetical protein
MGTPITLFIFVLDHDVSYVVPTVILNLFFPHPSFKFNKMSPARAAEGDWVLPGATAKTVIIANFVF